MDRIVGRKRRGAAVTWAGSALAAALIALAPTAAQAWECSIEVEKTVAPDDNCDGDADGTFVDAVTQDEGECVVYRFCVTNTSDVSNPQAIEDVEVTDSRGVFGPLDFGTVAIGATECLTFPYPESEGSLLCEDFEGTNTATITSAICGQDRDSACARPLSDCEDTANVACEEENGRGCLTRTPGYLANHPDVVGALLEQYGPVSSCGSDLTVPTLALCPPGRADEALSPQQAQLTRQCAAAALNIALSDFFGGDCGEAATDLFDECCGTAALCASVPEDCIEDLTDFNESDDTLFEDLCEELGGGPPCAAEPLQCGPVVTGLGKFFSGR